MKEELDKPLQSNTEGYNLVSLSEEIWSLEVVGIGNFTGSFREVVMFAVLSYAFNIIEIDKAIGGMLKDNHNSAHFGMFGTFIFSFEKKFDLERKAS